MNNVPVDLYLAIRSVADGKHPNEVLNEEIPDKYGDIDTEDLLKKYCRLLSHVNPDDFDHANASNIKKEQRLSKVTAAENEIPVDITSPMTPEESEKVKRFRGYLNQKELFTGHRSGKREKNDPGNVTEDTIRRIKNLDANDPDLSYFDDMGKHLYIHHGWCLEDYQAHPSPMEREIAHHIEHIGLLGSKDSDDPVYFDELAKPFSSGTHIPVLGSIPPNLLESHMKLLHGYPDGFPVTAEDHKRDHVMHLTTNHVHDITSL